MASLATLADFEVVGLRREAFSARRKAIASVDPATDRLSVDAHGWSGSEPLQLEAIALPGVTPALPGGLSASTVYYPLPVAGSDNLFGLSLTVGGAAINLTDAGTGAFYVRQSLGPLIASALEFWSDVVRDAMPADLDGSSKAPAFVTCVLAAYDVAITQGLMSPERWQEGEASLGARRKQAEAILERWTKRGAPPRKPVTDGVDALQNGTFVDTAPAADDGFGISACGEATVG